MTPSFSLGQYERALIRARTKAALAIKKANGERVGLHAPYGYRFNDDGRVVEDDGEQEILTLIGQYRVEGLSIRRMADELARQGICNRKGNPMHFTQVGRILRGMKHA